MLRSRLLILLGGCLLAASAAWADGVAYVDCSTHPEDTQVFAKPRKTPDVVTSLPCGERFTVILNGFIFSRIQTRDGQVGYVYSNIISADRSGASVLPPTSTRSPAAASSATATTATVVQSNPTAPAQPQSTPAQPAPTQAPATTSNLPSTAATVVQPNPSRPTQTQPTPAQPASPQAPANTSSVPETSVTPIQATPTAPTQPQATPVQLAPTEAALPTASVPQVTAAVVQPDPTPVTQPEPAPAEPAASAIRPANARESWEKPNAGLRTVGLRRMPLIELFGGYGFARLDGGGGTSSNLHGALGSFAWNATPWLQIVADTSYNVVTVSGTKNVLYGNHYGPRLFRRGRNRWGMTPFVEGLVGGSRADTTVSGTYGYKTSTNSISFKVGGGLDIYPSQHFKIRLFDVDYYRTSFGVNLHQNNYWASAGIVLRLFGGRSE